MTSIEATENNGAQSGHSGAESATAVVGRAQRVSRVRIVGVIALNTFRESVRDRILYNLVLFALILTAASVFISDLSIQQEAKFISDLGLSAMLVFGALIAIFIGVGLVFKEIDKRTIYNLLSKPVRRHEFLIGKYLGLCMTLAVNCALMTAGTDLAIMYVVRGFGRLEVAILPAAFMIFLELALVTAIALMFSTFTTPALSALFSFALYVTGHFSADLKLAASLSESPVVKQILTFFYYVLPNLANFGYISEASHGWLAPLSIVLWATAYAVLYVGILLSISIAVFQSRNFK